MERTLSSEAQAPRQAMTPYNEATPANLRAALEYEALGLSVIPLHGIVNRRCTCGNPQCGSPGKHPIGKWKHRQQQRATPDELIALFKPTPHANVGIVTGSISGLVVLDIDNPGIITDNEIMAKILGSFRGPIVVTGRRGGGFHAYFRHPGFVTGNFAKRLEGLDGRGDGGYVVAPPSMHESGTAYTFANNFGFDNSLPELPIELTRMFDGGQAKSAEGGYAAKALANEKDAIVAAREGERNSTLNRSAFNIGQLVGAGQIGRAEAEAALIEAGHAAGLSGREVRATVESGLTAGMSRPRDSKSKPTPLPPQETQEQAFNPLDLSVLNGFRRKPPSFPSKVFPPALAKWCEDAAVGAGAPLDYVVGTLLAVSGTLIGNARRISPKPGWVDPAHIWVMLVGDPSAGKTPGTRPVLRLLDPIERERFKQFMSELEAYEAAKVAADAAEALWKTNTKKAVEAGEPAPAKPKEAIQPKYPVLSRIKVNDATREKLALLASQNPKGLLFERDELAGWLNDFNRYGLDGGRQDWLMAYNGNPHRIDRVKHPEPVDIPHWSVGVIGGIQPERLRDSILAEVDDGLSARFLYIWPDRLEPVWTDGVTLDETASRAMWRLCSLNLIPADTGEPAPVVIPVSPSGKKLFSHWWEQHGRTLPTGSRLKGHYGKMPGMLLRLALILEYLWWAADAEGMSFGDTITEVSERSIKSGITLIEEYFKPMALRIFQDAETPDGDRHAPALAHWILKRRPSRFNASHVRTREGCPSGLKDAKVMNAACEALRDFGVLRYVGERKDGKPGRKSTDWEVNPEFLSLTD